MQGVHSTSLQSSVAILSVSHHSHLPKIQSIHFAKSSSFMARMWSAFVFWIKCGHFLSLVLQHIVHELFFLQFMHSVAIFIFILLSAAQATASNV